MCMRHPLKSMCSRVHAFMRSCVHVFMRTQWNESGGADHIWLFGHDEGACWAPSAIYNTSIILSHWGRLGPPGPLLDAYAARFGPGIDSWTSKCVSSPTPRGGGLLLQVLRWRVVVVVVVDLWPGALLVCVHVLSSGGMCSCVGVWCCPSTWRVVCGASAAVLQSRHKCARGHAHSTCPAHTHALHT
jgi:hypothetical protein